jgi:hypothetical protein
MQKEKTMKNKLFLALAIIVLAVSIIACGSSGIVVATPTATLLPTNTLFPTSIPLPTNTLSPEGIIEAGLVANGFVYDKPILCSDWKTDCDRWSNIPYSMHYEIFSGNQVKLYFTSDESVTLNAQIRMVEVALSLVCNLKGDTEQRIVDALIAGLAQDSTWWGNGEKWMPTMKYTGITNNGATYFSLGFENYGSEVGTGVSITLKPMIK